MPFDSQGRFTRVHNWEDDRINDIDIVTDHHDEEDDNFAEGFNQCLLRDGRAALEGNMDAGGFQIKNLSNGSLANDAVNKSQLDGQISNLSSTLTEQVNLKAPIASPTFTGKPTVPTPADSSNDTQAANTEWTNKRIISIMNNINPVSRTDLKPVLALDKSYTFTQNGIFVISIHTSSQTNAQVTMRMTNSGAATATSAEIAVWLHNGGAAEHNIAPFSFPVRAGQSIYLQTSGGGGKEITSAYLFPYQN